jgi:Immunity protein 21
MNDVSEAAMKDFKYLVCDGGPHLVLPHSARRRWKGVEGDLLDSDYGRACSVASPIGLISVGQAQALVIAGSPPMSTWGPTPREKRGVDLYVLHSWKSVNLDALVRSAAADTPMDEMVDTGLRWMIGDGGATLMSAGDRPEDPVYGEVSIPISAGTFSILEGRYEAPNGQLSIFRLIPA